MPKDYAFSLIEVLISLTILSFALLSLVRLQVFIMSYQYEATLLAKAANVVSDVTLSYIYNCHDLTTTYHNVQTNFSQGMLIQSGDENHIQVKLTWKVPRLPLYQLNYQVRN